MKLNKPLANKPFAAKFVIAQVIAVQLICQRGFGTKAFASEDLDFLGKLVAQSSDTSDASGVNAVQDLVAARLKQDGFSVNFIENPKADMKSGKMLVAELLGKEKRFLTLVAHADTVFKTLNPFAVSADGKTATGSGIIDAKGESW